MDWKDGEKSMHKELKSNESSSNWHYMSMMMMVENDENSMCWKVKLHIDEL